MSTYWVTHPNIDLSATVHAPSTEKARTLFLDYLERSNRIGRAQRGPLRENMVAEKMSNSEDIMSDVELYYGEPMGEEPTLALDTPQMEGEETPGRTVEEGEEWLAGRAARRSTGLPDLEEEDYEEPRQEMPLKTIQRGPVGMPIQAIQKVPPRMPIQELARGRLR